MALKWQDAAEAYKKEPTQENFVRLAVRAAREATPQNQPADAIGMTVETLRRRLSMYRTRGIPIPKWPSPGRPLLDVGDLTNIVEEELHVDNTD